MKPEDTRRRAIVFLGPTPAKFISSILTECEKYGYETFDGLIAARIGATMVLLSREEARKWRKELYICFLDEESEDSG